MSIFFPVITFSCNHRISSRTDIVALWGNFCILERRKHIFNHETFAQSYFWRTKTKQEIDYIEERDGHLTVFECKYSKEKAKIPKVFLSTYGDVPIHILTRKNINKL